MRYHHFELPKPVSAVLADCGNVNVIDARRSNSNSSLIYLDQIAIGEMTAVELTVGLISLLIQINL